MCDQLAQKHLVAYEWISHAIELCDGISFLVGCPILNETYAQCQSTGIRDGFVDFKILEGDSYDEKTKNSRHGIGFILNHFSFRNSDGSRRRRGRQL